MQNQKPRAPRQTLSQPMAAILVASASCGAWAQEDPSPYYIGVSQAFVRDSNVYRIPDGPRDYYSSTGLLGGFDQMVSRQHLYANATVNFNKYKNQDQLDNTSYGLKAGWDWETIEKLSGSFFGNANQSLAAIEGNAAIPLTAKNLLKTDQLGTTIKWGGEGLLSLEGNYAHSRVRYSAPEYFAQESEGDTASAGIFYRAGPTLRLGTAYRYTKSESPYGVPVVTVPAGTIEYVPETSRGRNIDLTADWVYSEQSNIKARLSWTKQTYTSVEARDFSGLTGAFYANYTPTGKLTFNLSYVRDAGINPAFYNVANAPPPAGGTPGSTFGIADNAETVDTAGIGVRWAATAKIAATARYQYRRSKLVNTVVVGGVATNGDANDVLHLSTLGLTYDINRAWQLACNFSYESRNVSGVFGFEYNANVVGCSAQFMYR